MQHKHIIRYQSAEGVHETTEVLASSAGEAFAKCQKANPGALMIQASRYGKFLDGEGWTHYQPPKVQRDPQKEPGAPGSPLPQEKDGVMPFYDEVVSLKKPDAI